MGWIIWLYFLWEIKKKDYSVLYCVKRCLYWLYWVGFLYIYFGSIYFIMKKKMIIKKLLYLILKINVFIFMILIVNEIYLYFFNIKNIVWYFFVNFKSFFLKMVKVFSYFDLFILDGILYVWKYKIELVFKLWKIFFYYFI